MNEETKRILIITVGIFLSVISGTYIYTQNTGFNACYNKAISVPFNSLLNDDYSESEAVYICSKSN
jgi:hypothetical protein